jgi:hypothetical protein
MRLIGASASKPAGQISRQCRRREVAQLYAADGGCLRTALRLHRFPRPAYAAAHLNYPHRHGRWVFVLGASLERGAGDQVSDGCRTSSAVRAFASAVSGRAAAGNCSTAARWPLHRRVSSTTCPSGNSNAS